MSVVRIYSSRMVPFARVSLVIWYRNIDVPRSCRSMSIRVCSSSDGAHVVSIQEGWLKIMNGCMGKICKEATEV
jgi:hypothetical protein